MFEIINAFKEGYSVWKGVWLRQIIVPMVLGFVFSLIIIPFGFLIAIFGTDLRDSGGVGNNSAGISGLFQQIIDYPLFWLSILATAFIGMIIFTILTGSIQNIAHQRFLTEDVRLEDNFKISPLIIPLAIVAILMSIIGMVLFLITGEIFRILEDPNAPVLFSFPIFDATAEFSLMDTLSAIFSTLIFIIILGPYFLGITSAIVDNTGNNSFVEGWKLFSKKPGSVFVAMLLGFLVIFITFLVMYIPINGIVTAGNETPTNLPLLFFSIFIVIILGTIFLYFVNNWLTTSLYCYYKAIKS